MCRNQAWHRSRADVQCSACTERHSQDYSGSFQAAKVSRPRYVPDTPSTQHLLCLPSHRPWLRCCTRTLLYRCARTARARWLAQPLHCQRSDDLSPPETSSTQHLLCLPSHRAWPPGVCALSRVLAVLAQQPHYRTRINQVCEVYTVSSSAAGFPL
jgi:hypothetical protein